MKTISYSQLEEIKRAAKRLKKNLGISHSEALERLAKKAGFLDFHALQNSIQEPRPHEGMTSSADAKYQQILLKPGKIWFALDVKDAENYNHKTFPGRWGIKEDEAKFNKITDDLLKAVPAKEDDDIEPSYSFYSWNRLFLLDRTNQETLQDVVSYVREVFFWGPRYVFQADTVYDCSGKIRAEDYNTWLHGYGKHDEEDDDEIVTTYINSKIVSFQG